jgi:hypothetical protein
MLLSTPSPTCILNNKEAVSYEVALINEKILLRMESHFSDSCLHTIATTSTARGTGVRRQCYTKEG